MNKTRTELLLEMYKELENRKLVVKTRNGRCYHTWRTYKKLKEGDVILVDGTELSIIIDNNWEELEFEDLDDIIEKRYKEVSREYKLNRILPECNRDTRINYLLKKV